jgi:hypothetical protein
MVVGCSQTRDRIPAWSGREATGATARVTTLQYIVESLWVLINNRIDESNNRLARLDALLVDEGNDTGDNRAGGRSATCQQHSSLTVDDGIDTVCRDIRIATGTLCVIVSSNMCQ